MPSVSQKQHNAMEAAAHGHSTLGIPKRVGEEFSKADAKDAAPLQASGTIFVAPDGRVLLLLRSELETNYGGHWALPGGKADEGETPLDASIREAEEEIGAGHIHACVGEPTVVSTTDTPNGMVFTTFAQPVRYAFTPELNYEHSGFGWFDRGSLPRPIHPAVLKVLR